MDRKTKFWAGFILAVFIYSIPIAGLAVAGAFWYLAMVAVCFFFSVYMIYRITIRNMKPRYPLINPEGHPDVYSGRMPRPIYKDMERYPWFFKKKKRRPENEKREKKH